MNATATIDDDFDQSLILAAEDCPAENFDKLHIFHAHEERIIQALCAHGPVLIRGGRGGGKSALMIEAKRRLARQDSPAIGVYLSLRHVPLLRSIGQEYEKLFCQLLSGEILRTFPRNSDISQAFRNVGDVSALQQALRGLVERTGRRIVLLLDDVAHIGREASLEEFFGIFRTISSSNISCKASIYPGVTRFGIRFDIYNDATVFDLARDERSQGYAAFFWAVLQTRFPTLANRLTAYKQIRPEQISAFLGRAVVGNMRGFVFACSRLDAQEGQGLPALDAVLKSLSADYYWPLLEEIEPKLGVYRPLVETSRELAESIFRHAAAQGAIPTLIVHRDIVQGLAKTFEILEYAGFIAKREASRAMRSGGRGPRYALNLANLLEVMPKARLTRAKFDAWIVSDRETPIDIQPGNVITLTQPRPDADEDLRVFYLPIDKLRRSKIYPYGLTDLKIDRLRDSGFTTIGDLAAASTEQLLQVPSVSDAWAARIHSIVGQAVWM